jgi:hypothetical protein
MARLTKLPSGNAINMQLVASINLYPGKGVACRDDEQRMLAWIEVTDIEKGKQARQLLIRLTRPGMGGVDPDWGFLDE